MKADSLRQFWMGKDVLGFIVVETFIFAEGVFLLAWGGVKRVDVDVFVLLHL